SDSITSCLRSLVEWERSRYSRVSNRFDCRGRCHKGVSEMVPSTRAPHVGGQSRRTFLTFLGAGVIGSAALAGCRTEGGGGGGDPTTPAGAVADDLLPAYLPLDYVEP